MLNSDGVNIRQTHLVIYCMIDRYYHCGFWILCVFVFLQHFLLRLYYDMA